MEREREKLFIDLTRRRRTIFRRKTQMCKAVEALDQ
jgi:hypothetical protein